MPWEKMPSSEERAKVELAARRMLPTADDVKVTIPVMGSDYMLQVRAGEDVAYQPFPRGNLELACKIVGTRLKIGVRQ